MGDDHFADFDEETTSQPVTHTASTESSDDTFATSGGYQGGGGGRFASEIHSEKIATKFRTFFLDVKESTNGKFLKISEKSRGGKKSTIMMDGEDVPEFIEALKRANGVLEK